MAYILDTAQLPDDQVEGALRNLPLIDPGALVLLRLLQRQITDLTERVEALEVE